MHILIFLIIGAIAGWLAGILMKGRGFGLVTNLLIGIVGAVLGGWLFGMAGVNVGGLFGTFAAAVVGAMLLLSLAGLLNRT